MPRTNDIRRRTGCLQCKEKHIRCTEEQPYCRRCETLGLSCTRGLILTFREDAVQRGFTFGREGVWSKRPTPKDKSRKRAAFQPVSLRTYINRWIFLNVTIDDFRQKRTVSEIGFTSASLLDPPVSPSIYHPLHAFPETDSFLLDYFIRVIPLSFNSDTLRNALLAVAANQLCLLGRPELRQEACHYKDKVPQGLRHQISNKLQDEGTIATVLMLCFQDISDGCSPSWLTHLRGGMQLMDYESFRHRSSPGLWVFFRMYFVAHDIMSRTASDEWRDKGGVPLWADDDYLEEIDVLMGCSRGLLNLIERVSVVASAKANILKRRPLNTSESHQYTITANRLHRAVINLKQTLPAHSHDREDLQQIAHIKRLVAQLYLIECLGPPPSMYTKANFPELSNSHETNPYQAVHRHTQSKHSLITSLITSISTLTNTATDPNTNMATLLWPLFILGNVSLENEEHRRFVLDKLMGIQKARNLGSVRRTIEAVKYTFGTKGLGVELGLGREGEGRFVNGHGPGGSWGCERWRGISLA